MLLSHSVALGHISSRLVSPYLCHVLCWQENEGESRGEERRDQVPGPLLWVLELWSHHFAYKQDFDLERERGGGKQKNTEDLLVFAVLLQKHGFNTNYKALISSLNDSEPLTCSVSCTLNVQTGGWRVADEIGSLGKGFNHQLNEGKTKRKKRHNRMSNMRRVLAWGSISNWHAVENPGFAPLNLTWFVLHTADTVFAYDTHTKGV